MNEELLAKYMIGPTVYDIFAVYHTLEDQYVGKVSFYEVYENVDGKIKRVNSPLYTMPTWNEVYHTRYAPAK